MHCTEYRDRLIDYMYGELPQVEVAQVESHLAGCAACARELRTLERTREILEAWGEVPLPARLLTPRETLAAGHSAGRWTLWRILASPWAPVGFGASAAVVTFLLLQGYVAVSPLPPLTHIVLGVLSGSLLAFLFRLALPGQAIPWEEALRRRWRIAPRPPARGALVSTGLACLLAATVPLPALFRLAGLSSDSMIAYGMGLLGYSAIAAAGAGLTVRQGGEGRFRNALALACLYAMALAPGLIVICLPLTVAIYLAALAGSILGATMGGLVGSTLAHPRAG